MNSKSQNSRQLYARLLRHVIPYWKIMVISVISLLILSSAEAAFAAVLEKMIDKIFVAKEQLYMYAIPAALVIISIVRGLMNFCGVISINWVANKIVMDLRQMMFERLLHLPVQFYNDNSSGNVISKIIFDVSQVTAAATETFVTIIRDTFTITFLIALMLYYNWQLTLISFISFPVIAFAVKAVSKRMRSLNTDLQDSMGDMTHVLEESVLGHKVVKVFGGHDYEKKRFDDVSNWIRRYANKVKITSTASVSFVQFITALALALIVFIAAKDAISGGDFTAGQFSAFFTAMGLLFSPIKRLTKINENLQRGLAASQSIFNLIDVTPEYELGKQLEQPLRGDVEFRNINFSYKNSEESALNDVSFSVKAGETVALVGQSGSGKTTIAGLLPRFYELEHGSIQIDGMDISELDLKVLRNNIALVSQDVVLFNDTVAANIAYGPLQNKKERDAIISAATAANAMEFIEKMPDGIDTLIGENGAKISGGQRQRLAIARAILKDAPILILDEATSALDTESEFKVQAALENLQKSRTTLVIAHRLSTIENSDRIIVLDKGKIVEQGTHQELIRKQSYYFKLHNAQFDS
ncbi:MAG: lipid A export permease/ATP-binding protein MsbA [Gammaproteobacteria bacterium]|nr:MAG: lipid A export permease/ATP-binding protein MsbA [Gammaproteobacteria bacterium]